jgi:hypothetical protein
MQRMNVDTRRWIVVVTYATAMAWVESAVVFYLRTWIDRIEPHQAPPLPNIGAIGPVELGREAATLVMLLTVGLLAGVNWRSRLGYSAVAFGVWDIFYYVFLKVMCDWPHSLADWDILFLIPLPWWGPVWAPVSIALLMITWGTVATRTAPAPAISRKPWALNACGILLALYVFMADALRVADQGVEVIRGVLPTEFNGPLFCVALGLMAAPLFSEWKTIRQMQNTAFSPSAAEPIRQP